MDQKLKSKTTKGVGGLIAVAVNAYVWMTMLKAGHVSVEVGFFAMLTPLGVFIVWTIFAFLGTWAGWTQVLLGSSYALWESYKILPPPSYLGWDVRSIFALLLIIVWLVYTVRRYQRGGLKNLFSF